MSAPSPDAVLHLAALHTLAHAGFASTSRAASVTLSTVLAKYLKLVATTCVERASLAGRGKVAAIDVVDALDDLGINVDELIDWSSDQNGDHFDPTSMGNLQEYLKEGLGVEEAIASMKLVPQDELEAEDDADDSSEPKQGGADVDMEQGEGEGHKDANMVKAELDEDADEAEIKPFIYRHKSPDFSWLPPLPNTHGSSSAPQDQTLQSELNNKDQTTSESAAIPAPTQSIADRYRRPISYASSQLSQAHPFHDPPRPSSLPTPSLPEAPTSLPNLISTYAAIASDPSIALRQTDLRRQATEILRQSIATVDSFSPTPTLSTPIPPVRASSIVPSHSDDILPQKLLPVNPNVNSGLISSLVNQINSPNLPYTLRERLTSLRPPVVQMRNDQPIFYNNPVRGPDELALQKFKSTTKPSHANENDEEGEGGEGGGGGSAVQKVYLKQTWDSGNRGIEKWDKPNLPRGKKVIIQREGEKRPRMDPADIQRREERERRQLEEANNQNQNQGQKVKVNLRLPNFNGIVNGGSAEVMAMDSKSDGSGIDPNIQNGNTSPNPDQIPPTPGAGSGLKIKFGNNQKLSISPSPAPPHAPSASAPNSVYPASVNPY
ncbi:uncharacterized protein I303_101638 [Kwoniella dejecticola CBS 10117]|uniref:Bromodomain associated domain-containing protein n=1 Tax=Kwoniella dejecticola CBS 10117 TaxID=1296121 RepID=A0A1A6AD78_9TREE|nr:uncharacterized protein I303_02226 [Kwoniella dejecticola CBS 10117]OBR88010.1 hypothetical protein I303_02226 [Kwoniella dejecticola CBS 10117]